MWFLVDAGLFGLVSLHLLITVAIATPADSPLKKPIGRGLERFMVLLDGRLGMLSAIGFMVAVCATTAVSGAWYDVTMRTRFCAAFLSLLSAPLYMKLTHISATVGVHRLLDLEEEVMSKDIANFIPPSLSLCDSLMKPYSQLFRSEAVGLERVLRDRPSFFVMNHSLLGLEMPCFVHLVYRESGIFLRGLADHFHWLGPHGPLLRAFGAVDGTRANVDVLQAAGASILVYPGGGAEIMKSSKVERYTLMWKERLGFARMAIKGGYPVQPCACVGTEDMLDIIADLPISFLKVGTPTLPVAVPNSLQKMYFWFGDPIPTEQYNGDHDNTEFAKELRDKTKVAIEQGIAELKQRQASDPDRFVMGRLARKIREEQSSACQSLRSVIGNFADDAKGD